MDNFKGMKMENSKVPAEQITNPDLKRAIENMQEDSSKENIDAMINEVIKAKFILPAKLMPSTEAHTRNGRTVMQQATQIQFRLLENNKKEKFFGIFTDTEELFKWKGTEAANKVVTNFDSIAQMVTDPKAGVTGFVINPFGKSVTFPKNMINSIKQQNDYKNLSKGRLDTGEVQLGDPEDYPIDLMAALINHFSTEENVNAAYLRTVEQNGKKSYLIVIDFVGDMQQTFEAASKAASDYVDEDEISLSMMPYSMDFARTAVKGVAPFYSKQSQIL